MALINPSKQAKEIIVAVVSIISFAFLTFAGIFGWDLKVYQAIIGVVVIILELVFGIVWANRPKPSDDTGGSG